MPSKEWCPLLSSLQDGLTRRSTKICLLPSARASRWQVVCLKCQLWAHQWASVCTTEVHCNSQSKNYPDALKVCCVLLKTDHLNLFYFIQVSALNKHYINNFSIGYLLFSQKLFMGQHGIYLSFFCCHSWVLGVQGTLLQRWRNGKKLLEF